MTGVAVGGAVIAAVEGMEGIVARVQLQERIEDLGARYKAGLIAIDALGDGIELEAQTKREVSLEKARGHGYHS